MLPERAESQSGGPLSLASGITLIAAQTEVRAMISRFYRKKKSNEIGQYDGLRAVDQRMPVGGPGVLEPASLTYAPSDLIKLLMNRIQSPQRRRQ